MRASTHKVVISGATYLIDNPQDDSGIKATISAIAEGTTARVSQPRTRCTATDSISTRRTIGRRLPRRLAPIPLTCSRSAPASSTCLRPSPASWTRPQNRQSQRWSSGHGAAG